MLELRVVSPAETLFEGAVSAVVLPAWDGRVGILPGHAPYIALLGSGMMEADLPGGGSERFYLRDGVVKVENDRVTVLSEYASREVPEGVSPELTWMSNDEMLAASSPDWNPFV